MSDVNDKKQYIEKTNTKKLLVTFGRYISAKLLLAIILLGGIGIFFIVLSFNKTESSTFFYLVREAGKALFITAIISGGVKWYMTRQYIKLDKEKDAILKHELSETLDNLTKKVLEQTNKMSASASSLDALQDADVVRFYRNRSEASKDIKAALQDNKVTTIKIIGISLNDFIRDEHTELHNAWKTIESYITNGTPPSGVDKLDVQVLLIDPTSYGALLRAEAEGTEDRASRLRKDVNVSMNDLYELEKECMSTPVCFQARIYRTTPILYLVWTPSFAFVQQYYFRPSHRADINIPIIKYYNKPKIESQPYSIHDELAFHFDWLWSHASISLSKYIDECSQGTALAMMNSGIDNIFYDFNLSRKRIIHLISDPENTTLWIKGISLRSFFQYGDLYDVIAKASKRENLDIKILLIDPDCEQAKIRSFREFLMTNPSAKPEEFREEARKAQRLYKDTTESITLIRAFLKELSLDNQTLRFKVKLFSSAPEAFMLITDKSALVEQYHYGKIRPVSTEEFSSKILGGDIPVLEYEKLPSSKSSSTIKDPYRIFRDHFQFVFDYFAIDFC